MTGFPKVSAVIAVIGLAAAIFLSRHLTQNRVELGISWEAREKMTYVPFLGIDKLWADFNWMVCINHLGGITGAIDAKMADYFYRRFDRLTNLDPDFNPVYKIGAASIAYVDDNPTRALTLIDKAIKCSRKLDWYHPYQAAHWLLQISVRKAGNDEKARNAAFDKALYYLDIAIKNGAPWYVENMHLHTVTKKEGKDQNPFSELEAWASHYRKKMAEMEKLQAPAVGPGGAPPSAQAPGTGPSAIPPMPSAMTAGFVEGAIGADGESTLGRLRTRIADRCKQLVLQYLEEAKTESADKADLQAKADKVRAIYREVAPAGTYYCPYTLAKYEPGEMFDRISGVPVTPYGVDLYDLEKHGRVTLLKSDSRYNQFTGKPVARTFSELEAMLKQEGGAIHTLAPHHPEKTGQADMFKPLKAAAAGGGGTP